MHTEKWHRQEIQSCDYNVASHLKHKRRKKCKKKWHLIIQHKIFQFFKALPFWTSLKAFNEILHIIRNNAHKTKTAQDFSENNIYLQYSNTVHVLHRWRKTQWWPIQYILSEENSIKKFYKTNDKLTNSYSESCTNCTWSMVWPCNYTRLIKKNIHILHSWPVITSVCKQFNAVWQCVIVLLCGT